MQPIIVGHRGVAGHYPENTEISFQAACDAGLTWIEVDVQPSSDNVLVVFHDHELERCSQGRGRVDEHALATLKTLDIGTWFEGNSCPQQMMTLPELLDWVNTHGMSLNIEIKVDEKHDHSHVAKLVYDTLQQHPVKTTIRISSFSHDVLRAFHQLTSEYPLAVLTESLTDLDWQLLVDIQATACHIDYRSLSSQLIERFHQAGYEVWIYTLNQPETFELFSQVDGVFTDYPEKFQ